MQGRAEAISGSGCVEVFVGQKISLQVLELCSVAA